MCSWIELARSMKPRHIMGLDIDPSLIQKARVHLRNLAAKAHGTNVDANGPNGPNGHTTTGAAGGDDVSAGDTTQGSGVGGARSGGQAEGGGVGGGGFDKLDPPLSAISYKGTEVWVWVWVCGCGCGCGCGCVVWVFVCACLCVCVCVCARAQVRVYLFVYLGACVVVWFCG
jgi:hypothetical protein